MAQNDWVNKRPFRAAQYEAHAIISRTRGLEGCRHVNLCSCHHLVQDWAEEIGYHRPCEGIRSLLRKSGKIGRVESRRNPALRLQLPQISDNPYAFSDCREKGKRLHALIRHWKGNCIISLPYKLQKRI
jgi:hypothetical protein